MWGGNPKRAGLGTTDRWIVVLAQRGEFKAGIKDVVVGREESGRGGMLVRVEQTGVAEFGWVVGGVEGRRAC